MTGVQTCALPIFSDIRAFQYVDGVKHPADGQLLYRGYDVKDLINGSRGSRFAFEEAGYLLLFGQLPTPEQLEQFCAVLGLSLIHILSYSMQLLLCYIWLHLLAS